MLKMMKEGDMQQIYTDKNGHVKVECTDEGHYYDVIAGRTIYHLKFQKGAEKEVGLNGVTSEALIAILINRTKTLNTKFSCKQNGEAIESLEKALESLQARTKDRVDRKVEGKMKK